MLVIFAYTCDYVLDEKLDANHVLICVFEFIFVHCRKLVFCNKLKLGAVEVIEIKIDLTFVISIIFRTYGEI